MNNLVMIGERFLNELVELSVRVNKHAAKARFIELMTPIMIAENPSLPQSQVKNYVKQYGTKALNCVLDKSH